MAGPYQHPGGSCECGGLRICSVPVCRRRPTFCLPANSVGSGCGVLASGKVRWPHPEAREVRVRQWSRGVQGEESCQPEPLVSETMYDELELTEV